MASGTKRAVGVSTYSAFSRAGYAPLSITTRQLRGFVKTAHFGPYSVSGSELTVKGVSKALLGWQDEQLGKGEVGAGCKTPP